MNDTKPPADPGTPPPVGTPEPAGTWSDGHVVSGNINIPAGTTVTIAAGAQIKIAPDASITVAGELKGTAGATHAKLAPTSGTWGGLVVASGGKLTFDSVDIAAAKIAVWTQKGNLDASFANGSIDATQPFHMEAGSKLSVSKSTAKAESESEVAGTFTASYMTYDKGTAEGLYANDPAALIQLSDCTLKGNGGGDYVVVTAATNLKVEYTTITGSHCPFHFGGGGPTAYTVDHVSDDTNGYGWMLYGSGAGPNVISNSNFADGVYNIEMTGTNGKVTLTNNFFVPAMNPNKLQTAATTSSTANARIANAKPR